MPPDHRAPPDASRASNLKKAERWRIDAFELCVGEDSWESFGLQGDTTSQP